MARLQEERSAETRGRLLDATVACLHEFGYAGTTTTEIARRAGVSRGAQVHHGAARAVSLPAATTCAAISAHACLSPVPLGSAGIVLSA